MGTVAKPMRENRTIMGFQEQLSDNVTCYIIRLM
jgi:hypothetical protein